MSVGVLDPQRMLLQDLYETKVCNSMLFPESDEEIWKHEDVQISVSPLGVHISKGDSKSGRLMPLFNTASDNSSDCYLLFCLTTLYIMIKVGLRVRTLI